MQSVLSLRGIVWDETEVSKSNKRGFAKVADTTIDRLRECERIQRRVDRVLVADKEDNVLHLPCLVKLNRHYQRPKPYRPKPTRAMKQTTNLV